MPVIRFVREGVDVECYPGENLREVALRNGVELYGLKGKLGNCGGCGQCITCFVDVIDIVEGDNILALSRRTQVEELKLRRRPKTWRLACQVLVQRSVLILTRPQVSLSDAERRVSAARTAELLSGPTEWPLYGLGRNVSAEQSATSNEGDEEPALNSDTVA
ncbi:possible ferredoxin (chromatophore) [Paulinella micropora]|uniref:Possible ferredoxin n=1 Tax=Paulinella micropora TaxID=1928728 RepID=A0A1L5YCH8_9EUKA|nr:putative ferredoxin (2Fe-2S) [Paulinella micropora]AQX45164.1 putative ferredoxin (2Fe-2S) [Paulinella micropora]BBL86381.1 possible ferredoxin [Paulinella micropora]